jgi:hypothetical protein
LIVIDVFAQRIHVLGKDQGSEAPGVVGGCVGPGPGLGPIIRTTPTFPAPFSSQLIWFVFEASVVAVVSR